MDCFYAAVHERDDPTLKSKPIAVGGLSQNRGVIATANYVAREFGVRSAMATHQAMKLCPNLILLPGDMAKYREISASIREIFKDYSDLVEPLSLDEAFIDVTGATKCYGSATLIAKEIRQRIYAKEQLTASAGVSVNKFLAKVASDWKKPNGQFVILPRDVADFVMKLPVRKIFGVGPVTADKLSSMGILTCQDLQAKSRDELQNKFGKFGESLHNLARGIDEREVNPNRIRKSVSIEETFVTDLQTLEQCRAELPQLLKQLDKRLMRLDNNDYHKVFIKLKFHDFTKTTVETVLSKINITALNNLLEKGFERGLGKSVRLLGLGVRLNSNKKAGKQLELGI